MTIVITTYLVKYAHGSGHGTEAVLLPGFVINSHFIMDVNTYACWDYI